MTDYSKIIWNENPVNGVGYYMIAMVLDLVASPHSSSASICRHVVTLAQLACPTGT